MTTQKKIESKGYKVSFNIGWVNGEQRVISVSATKGNYKNTTKNITQLYKSL